MTAARNVLNVPPGPRQRTSVSLTHSVASQLVVLTLIVLVICTWAKALPATVMLTDPVERAFATCSLSATGESNESSPVTLPLSIPDVTTCCRVEKKPLDMVAMTSVSLLHLVFSLVVAPKRWEGVKSTRPMFSPFTVTFSLVEAIFCDPV